MIDLKLKQLQGGFFDRDEVLRRIGKARAAVLSKAGAFVRRRAQTSIRPSTKGQPSKPGNPPRSHTKLLRKFIYFSYDNRRESVLIGPMKLNAVVSKTTLPALEFGGKSVVAERDYSTGRRRMKTRPIRVKARPFMGPALAAEQPNFPRLWKDSIR